MSQHQGRRERARLAVLWLALGLVAGTVQAQAVRAVRVGEGATGTRAEIVLDEQAEFSLRSLDSPPRLAVDLRHARRAPSLQMPAGAGIVRRVRTGHPEASDYRIVFDLDTPSVPVNPHYERRGTQQVLVLEWPGDNDDRPAPGRAAQAEPTPRREAEPADETLARAPRPAHTTPTSEAPVRTVADVARRAGGRTLLIAIDAGHGGQDSGAHGPSGTYEKNVTLAIARDLARQVNATPGLRAYLTRDADFFIPLTERYQKARARKADMFVSIHADAFTDPNAQGSSVFVLSRKGASSQAARWLADQENAADLVGGVHLRGKDGTLATVLLDLSQNATQRASEDIAGQVLRGLADLGKTHRGEIERANFVVLRSPDVPSMLVETGFISNPDEEHKLLDPEYQHELARAVLNGIHTYFRRQPPPGTQYASLYGHD